ncbi:MAG TPA: hypothetical protein VM096_20520 [Vicinamibacterales bacterium]|nr:hypothetical protein [Vicinamibacterales bacterium]
MTLTRILAGIALLSAVACGQNSTPAPSGSPAPSPAAPAPSAAAKAAPTGTISLIEPVEGAMSGHIDTFRWSPVQGADGYVIKIVAVTGDRTIWESQPLTATETKLPPTVALEPEVHTWSVSARKGAEVLATSPTQRFTITP